MNWFYAYEGQPLGPVNDSELAHLAATGRIDGSTLVWHNALPDWRPYAEVAPLPAMAPPALPLIGAAASALPSPGTALPYAGFWIRVAAALFDGLIAMPIIILAFIAFFVAFPNFLSGDETLGAGVRALFQLALVAAGAGLETLFVGLWGATPGKMICNLRIVQADGGRVTYLRAFCRYFAKRLNTFTLGLGYLIVAFDAEKRGLHDYICSTRVIHSEPVED